MANFKRKRRTTRKRLKSGGFIVKGITARHWWDRYDKDHNSSREQLQRHTQHEIDEALAMIQAAAAGQEQAA